MMFNGNVMAVWNCYLLESFKLFVLLITAKCIDSYTEQRVYKADNPDEDVTIDPRLEAIVGRMFKRCFDDGKYKQVGVSQNFLLDTNGRVSPSGSKTFIIIFIFFPGCWNCTWNQEIRYIWTSNFKISKNVVFDFLPVFFFIYM